MVDLDSIIERFEGYIAKRMEVRRMPGVSVAVTDPDRTRYVGTFGLADVPAQAPVTPDTLFQIGSISKSFTAMAIMRLKELGELDTRDTVEQHLPWFEVRSEHPPITLHHLLTHTAAIPMGTESTMAPESEVWALRDLSTSAPPGEHFHYSNTGYKALGLVLERVTGKPYADVINEFLLAPLGMDRTHPVITNGIRRSTAVGYTWLHDDRPPGRRSDLAPATWFEGNTADGSITSMPEDMARYIRMVMNRGKGDSRRVLSRESLEAMVGRRVRPEPGKEEFYGYGLSTEVREGRTYIGHTGGMVGYTSSMLIDDDRQLGVIVLTNSMDEPERISRYLMDLINADAEGSPLPEPHIPEDAFVPEDPGEYAGVYGDGDVAVEIAVRGGRLHALVAEGAFALEGLREDEFLLDHPAYDRFVMRFVREDGSVDRLVHGPDTYGSHRNEPRDLPEAWRPFVGHYRSYNPWQTNFRVIGREGRLHFVDPLGKEEPMHHIGDALFRIGDEPRSPETICFEMVIDGIAHRANLSGGLYSRTFTP